MSHIPMVEGVVERVDDVDVDWRIPAPCLARIRLPHSTYGFDRALANAFAISESVVVIRKSDYEQLERFWTNEKER